MATRFREMQPLVAFAAANPDEDLSLEALAAKAGFSTFHLHRIFADATGETPKRLTTRLRLDRAAGLLLASGESVLDIALACGFQSHEVFTRAFRRRFGMTPTAYRERGLEAGGDAEVHAAFLNSIGQCVAWYRMTNEVNDVNYTVTTKEIAAQPILIMRRRIKRSEIAKMIGESLPVVFRYAQKIGATILGPPLARYLDWGPGMTTIEAGIPVALPVGATGEGDVLADTLPGGLVATTIHPGVYDKLPEAHGAIQQWVEEHGLKAAGAPWESYVTDPGEEPDPKDWKTEVFWPVKRDT